MMEITFPGGVAVDATFNGLTVKTDQPAPLGSGDHPAPFDLFLASLGTCAGLYALRFCQQRGLDTEGLRATLETEYDMERRQIGKVRIDLHLPEGFPEKYRSAVIRSASQCAVKRHIESAPDFEVNAVTAAKAA